MWVPRIALKATFRASCEVLASVLVGRLVFFQPMVIRALRHSVVKPDFVTSLSEQSFVVQLLELLLVVVGMLELRVRTSAFVGTDKVLLALVEVEAVVNALPLLKTWGIGNNVHVKDVIVGLLASAKRFKHCLSAGFGAVDVLEDGAKAVLVRVLKMFSALFTNMGNCSCL